MPCDAVDVERICTKIAEENTDLINNKNSS